jgi:hypothetical protein
VSHSYGTIEQVRLEVVLAPRVQGPVYDGRERCCYPRHENDFAETMDAGAGGYIDSNVEDHSLGDEPESECAKAAQQRCEPGQERSQDDAYRRHTRGEGQHRNRAGPPRSPEDVQRHPQGDIRDEYRAQEAPEA